jgi:hypothetical protein
MATSSIAKLSRVLGVVASVAAGACSSASKDVATSYVSPTQYAGYSCEQINVEMQRTSHRMAELGGQLDKNAQTDKMIVGAGAVLFWPALFFVGGTANEEAEYGRVKGEVQALESAAVQKNCFAQAAPADRRTPGEFFAY